MMVNKIGLIGGLAYRAGIFYYEQLLQRYNLLKQPLPLILNHADVNKVLAYVGAGQKAELGSYLGTLANELFDGGARVVAVTAVAPHLAIQELSEIANGPIVSLLDIMATGVEAAGLKRVAIFGNRVVMQTNAFGALSKDVVVPLDPSLVEAVHTTYTEIALHGKRGTQPERERLHKAARELMDQSGAEAIVLAGTDLSSFYAEQKPEYPFLDVAELHLDEILRRMQLPS